jgi:hypothetical protein
VDLLTTIPFDWIVLGAMGLQQSSSTQAWYISLLRLLRIGRMYRLYNYVMFLTYHQAISLLLMTLARNVVVHREPEHAMSHCDITIYGSGVVGWLWCAVKRHTAVSAHITSKLAWHPAAET